MVFSINTIAQDQSLKYDETFARYTGYVLADSTDDSDSVRTYSVFKISDARLFPTIEVGLDSVSGTAQNVKVILYKRLTQYDEWSKHDSATWTGVTTDYTYSDADTIIQFSITSAAKEEWWKWESTPADASFHYVPEFTFFKFLK